MMLLLTGVCTYAQNQEPAPAKYLVKSSSTPLSIDGKLDSTWDSAPWSGPFVDIEGYKKPAPTFNTRIKMLYDDQFLYIFAEMEEPHLWGTLTNRDAIIYRDNDFEVFLFT